MFWNKRAKNIVPNDYEFMREYEISVVYTPDFREERPWRASVTGWTGARYGKTKEEAIILVQNDIYTGELKQKALADNPNETFTIPPIRKF